MILSRGKEQVTIPFQTMVQLIPLAPARLEQNGWKTNLLAVMWITSDSVKANMLSDWANIDNVGKLI